MTPGTIERAEEHDQTDHIVRDDVLVRDEQRAGTSPHPGRARRPSSTIQMTEPNVIPSRRYWRYAGTRPKSSVLAQPSAVVRILPTKRDPNANSAARIAMAASVPPRA